MLDKNAKVDIDQQIKPIKRESYHVKPGGFFCEKKNIEKKKTSFHLWHILVHVCVCPIKIQGLRVF